MKGAGAVATSALFPISVSNQAFSTERVLPAMQFIFSRYAEVVFLVADHLQLYNKALEITDGLPLSRIIGEFSLKQEYRNQRSKWVQRMTSQIYCGHSHWKLIGIDDITDSKCFNIFRNVMLAYYSVASFQNDVNRSAHSYAQSRDTRYPLEIREQLSRGYLLEEIALNVRLHVTGGLDHEYYMGQQSALFLNLYNDKYEFNAFDLAETLNDGRRIRFFCFNGGAPENWTEQLPISAPRSPTQRPSSHSDNACRCGSEHDDVRVST
jgi:hypothetical protein